VAIADTYDAITSSRAYRRARGQDAALSEIVRCSGSQFDPDLANLFIEICRPPGGGCAPFNFEEEVVAPL
jgi:HD-GYP domain-containing protein (c-di-GMP phosphodiesterase class II)